MRVGALEHTPDENDLRLIRAMVGAETAADDLYVRSMVLCTGDYDRDYERFTDDVLEQFARSIVGKSLLIGHRHDSAPEGLFYRAEVVERPGATRALKAWFFMPRTEGNEHVRRLMDTGVLRYVSIGFRAEKLVCDVCGRNMLSASCGHIAGREYDGRVATGSWTGAAEAVEGSLVYLGSQYDAMLTKGASLPRPLQHEELDYYRSRAESLAALLHARETELAEAGPLIDEGRCRREELRRELRSRCALAGATDLWTSVEGRVESMTAPELSALCARLDEKLDWLRPPDAASQARRESRVDTSGYVRP